MALPVLLKTWNFNVNNLVQEDVFYDNLKHALHTLKVALASFSQWSVVASSNSVSVKNIGDASPDLWADWATDIVGGSGAHSWIILENSVTGGQFCIDVNNANYGYLKWYYSATGSFAADGTTSARPTDTESLALNENTYWLSNPIDGVVVNAMCSTDGKCTRAYVHAKNGAERGGYFFALEDLIGTPTPWIGTIHHAVLRMNSNIAMSTVPSVQDPGVSRYDIITPTNYIYQVDATPYEGWNTAFGTSEGYHQWYSGQGNGLYEVDKVLEWNEGYPFCPIGLFRDVATRGGGMGAFQDIYWGPKHKPSLSAFPDDSSNLWVKWGCFVVPWNGSVPLDVP